MSANPYGPLAAALHRMAARGIIEALTAERDAARADADRLALALEQIAVSGDLVASDPEDFANRCVALAVLALNDRDNAKGASQR